LAIEMAAVDFEVKIFEKKGIEVKPGL